ncbi:MAG: DUF3575 domain-containing protein [Rikenellaceae bacterium]
MKRQLSILTLLLLSLHTTVKAKSELRESEHSFRYSECAINLDYGQSSDNLGEISAFVKKLQADSRTTIKLIEINSFTSPIIEGNTTLKEKLKEQRDEIKRYLIEQHSIDKSLIYTDLKEIDWQELRGLVESSDMPYRDEVLAIVSDEGDKKWCRENPGDCWFPKDLIRTTQLKSLQRGVPYKYMERNIFPQLEKTVTTVWYSKDGQNLSEEFLMGGIPTPQPTVTKSTVIEPIKEPKPEKIKEPKVEKVKPEKQYIVSNEPQPLLAVKTNLLFDALSILNIELEVPIKQRFSVAGEWVFPWWISDDGTASSKRNRTQLLHGNLEGKYWFGDRTARPVMTGWFAGLYAGGGTYDFERSREGYQGEFFIAAGISGGYAHTINKDGNLRMEYSLGVGYLKTDYREYEAFFGVDDMWHPIRQKSGSYTWVGPTKAKVSLVWMFNKNAKRGGVR